MHHIILIGNYLPDRQESMNRFAQMLQSGYSGAGLSCEIWRPKVFFGRFSRSKSTGLGKWLCYIDKWIIFPYILRFRMMHNNTRKMDIKFHVCDHSNAPYLKCLPLDKTVITCHDVLAIRGALGYEDTFCEASLFGKILQRWILKHLSSAKKLAADTHESLKQLQKIVPSKIPDIDEWRVIYIGFNNHFRPYQKMKALENLKDDRLKDTPFLLHVGSGLARKNRKLLIDMASLMGNKWKGYICYAGEDIDLNLLNYAASLGLKSRVISVVKPNHEMLIALYSSCEAFIFPSYSEGFGWPLIEAQACGAPVIASNVEPMPEVTGGAALHCDPRRPVDFAEAFYSLQNKNLRDGLIQMGFENCLRFDNKQMIKAYLCLHGLNQNYNLNVS